MKRYGFEATDEELTAIIRRVDVSADASASFAEFEEAIKPMNIEESDNEERVDKEDNPYEYDRYRQHHAFKTHKSPQLANPSRVKMENLMHSYYMQTTPSKGNSQQFTSPYREEDSYRSPPSKKYNADEMPYSRTYYES